MKRIIYICLFVIVGYVDNCFALTKWGLHSTAGKSGSIAAFYGPSQDFDLESNQSYDDDSYEFGFDIYGLSVNLGNFYIAGGVVEEISFNGTVGDETEGFGAQVGFGKSVYESEAVGYDEGILSVVADAHVTYLDADDDEAKSDLSYQELTIGCTAIYVKQGLRLLAGIELIPHSEYEEDGDDWDGSWKAEADSMFNMVLGVGYTSEAFSTECTVGLFGYNGIMLSAGFYF